MSFSLFDHKLDQAYAELEAAVSTGGFFFLMANLQ
jgi:hypothetical protein